MVNLKKIGAIATGALFVGATFGTVSAAFSGDMLVKNNAAVAKLVTSTQNPDATGNAADKAAANTVKNAVSNKYSCAGSSGSANCEFKYTGQNINDRTDVYTSTVSGTNGDDVEKTSTSGWNADSGWIVTDDLVNVSWTLAPNDPAANSKAKAPVTVMLMIQMTTQ